MSVNLSFTMNQFESQVKSESPRLGLNQHNPLTETDLGNRTDTKACLHCSKDTTNPKFCSISCAATYNNTKFPKRTPAVKNYCKSCGVEVLRRSVNCRKCIKTYTEKLTKADLRPGNANNFKAAGIRNNARRTYSQSGRSKSCSICEYSVHVEICHIKAIKDFPMSAIIKDINNINNLIALCRNHHWELDHGILKLPETTIFTQVSV